jgi:hypothetical protein
MYASLSSRRILPAALLILIFFAACGDDDDPGTPPAAPLWQEVDLGATPPAQVWAVDFHGDQGLALGLNLSGKRSPDVTASNQFFSLKPDGLWEPVDPVEIPTDVIMLDLAFDGSGKIALAGAQFTTPAGVVIDARGADPVTITHSGWGMITMDGGESFMVAGGRSQGGDLWTSTDPGAWNVDVLPLTGTNDSGFRDVYIRGDRAVACGFDDGADTLQVILERTTSTEWTKVPAGGPYTGTYFCIALSEAGTIFVGGIEGAGGMSPKAFLSQRSPGGLWAELILPDPEALHGVNDILIASDGSIYLACMGEGENSMANLVHADQGGVRTEITPFPGGLLQLGEAENGDIYAVGFRRNEQDGSETGVMLVKSP